MEKLEVNVTLRERVNQTVDHPMKVGNRFVLYLPTVNLRMKHNPAFSLACHLSNQHQLPVLVLAVVLDDTHLPITPGGGGGGGGGGDAPKTKAVVFTARRIAFVLEALQQASREWQDHGAGVAIRVHGPMHRTPHHLTLLGNSVAVVTDEPFVHPYLCFVQSVERVAKRCQVPVYRVDGSTTVPPCSMLMKHVATDGTVSYSKVPNKAWVWEKLTHEKRRHQVHRIVVERHLDAPVLNNRMPMNFFLDRDTSTALKLPSYWTEPNTPCPGKRPWTVEELAAVMDLKAWVLTWPGIDATVLPASQTHGSTAAGQQRWTHFRKFHLSNYAKCRNDITKPRAVSRMSCYLNYGSVSIFQIVHDIWQSKDTAGVSKFSDEIIKWREIGYAHAFGHYQHYNGSAVVPQWARTYLSHCFTTTTTTCSSTPNQHQSSYSLEQLESCTTRNDTWNAMQNYLNSTGELHNNARMTWGKTVVHWQKYNYSVDDILKQLVYLNDRFALDGLSPPSYAGILWCFGWCDKPTSAGGGGGIAEKSASRYRQGPRAFDEAKDALLVSDVAPVSIATMLSFQPHQSQSHTAKRQKIEDTTAEIQVKKGNNAISNFHQSDHSRLVG